MRLAIANDCAPCYKAVFLVAEREFHPKSSQNFLLYRFTGYHKPKPKQTERPKRQISVGETRNTLFVKYRFKHRLLST